MAMAAFTVTITSKGQLTLPVEIRRAWNLQVGEQVEFVMAEDERVYVRPRNLPASAIFGLLSHLKPDPAYASDDDAIAAQVRADDEATRSSRAKPRGGKSVGGKSHGGKPSRAA